MARKGPRTPRTPRARGVSRSVSRGKTRASSRRAKVDLAVELYAHARLALRDFGLTDSELRWAINRAARLAEAPRVSGPWMRDIHGLGRMLLEWSRDEEYVGPDGKPKVLAIKGPGATFETLAKRALPGSPLDPIVALACETAEVRKRPGGRIALLGSILVKVLKSPESHLAHVIRQIDQFLSTSLHNRRMHRQGRAGGRMERLSTGVIVASEFKPLMRELRPQIYDLLLTVDSSLQAREPKTRRALKRATAVSVGVYVSQEPDLERAGVSAPRPRKARSRR